MSRPSIEVRSLSKLYRLGVIGATTLQDAFGRWWYRATGREHLCHRIGEKQRMIEPSHPQAGVEPNTFWALRDVSFTAERGEVIGIIGRNGAGKSTLLKLLSRITKPTLGYAVLRGKVASLLEVGTGFHPELTGRENIYLNGAILGMTRKEIGRKLDEIVAFAEVAEFVDTPVKRYSSGMYVRLAFSVAAHLEQDILLVDEVLAVGDAQFQNKCLEKMQDVAATGRTVLFVSHNMSSITRLCNKAICLDHGRIADIGKVEDVVKDYLASASMSSRIWTRPETIQKNDEVTIDRIVVTQEGNALEADVDFRQPFNVEVTYTVHKGFEPFTIGMKVFNAVGTCILASSDDDVARTMGVERPTGEHRTFCVIPGKLLSPGLYRVDVWACVLNSRILDLCEGAIQFEIGDLGSPEDANIGVISPLLEWRTAASPL